MFGRIDPIRILMSLPAVFLAISFHEFAHAYTADRLGDPTPRNQGRLTLDPLVHVDWIGLIMFAVFQFGWARPVQTNPSKYKDKRLGSILVSLSGPAANLFLAIAAAVLYFIFMHIPALRHTIVMEVIHWIIFLNIVFAILNLIPIPPFDGYHVLKDLFFKRNVNFFWKYEQYSIFFLLAFIFLGVFNYIVALPATLLYRTLMNIGMFFSSLF